MSQHLRITSMWYYFCSILVRALVLIVELPLVVSWFLLNCNCRFVYWLRPYHFAVPKDLNIFG